MWKFFLMFGIVIDIFLPFKRTNQGKRFGFVKFKDVKDVDALLTKIKSVAVGAVPITVNEAKSRRSRDGGNMSGEGEQKFDKVTTTHTASGGSSLRDGSRDFKAVLQGSSEAALQSETCVLQATTRTEELLWLKRCVVGNVKHISLLDKISGLLERGGFVQSTVKYLGGLRVLIECSSPEAAQRLLVEGRRTLAEWFTEVEPCNLKKEGTRPGRVVWLNISGVPVHVWHASTFSMVAGLWGKVIEVEEFTAQRSHLHIGQTCILTKQVEMIDAVVPLDVEGVRFKVKVVEDVFDVVDYGARYAKARSYSYSEPEEEEDEEEEGEWLLEEGLEDGGESVDDSPVENEPGVRT